MHTNHTEKLLGKMQGQEASVRAWVLGMVTGLHWGLHCCSASCTLCRSWIIVTNGKHSIEAAILGVSGCLLKALSWRRNH